MKHVLIIILIGLLTVGCQRRASDADAFRAAYIVSGDSTATARRLYDAGRRLVLAADTLPPAVGPDSALHLFLFAADYSLTSSDHALRYDIQRQLALQYEAKNLFSLQQECQHAMLAEARALADPYRIGEATQQLAITTLAMPSDTPEQQVDEARRLARKAYTDAPRDSLAFRAETLLFLAQCYIADPSPRATHALDSAALLLRRAAEEWPAAADTELYQLTSIYINAHDGRTADAIGLISRSTSVYTRMEAWRLLREVAAERHDTALALRAADAMVALADTLADIEASASTTRIHALQHADALRIQTAEAQAAAASARATWLSVLLLLAMLLAVAALWALHMRRRVHSARIAELDALRTAAEVQQGATAVREENMQLQKRYYDHLFAIILPILNACRKKRGHIDLSEESWRLIEENTDLVLPGFTSKLRRQHPGLTADDIRFCCLVAMRVPNTIMAEVYAIAPSSIAVRKQRMKKKFDDRQAEQSLDSYLEQYG